MTYLVAILFTLTVITPFGLILWMMVYAARAATRLVGSCRGCGYDLRSLGHGRLCPECGHPFELNERNEPIS